MQISSSKRLLVILDILFVNGAILASYFLHNNLVFSQEYFSQWFNNAYIFTIIFVLLFWLFGLYKSLWRFASAEEILKITLANFVAMFSVGVLINNVFIQSVPWAVIIISFFISTALTGGIRYSYRISRDKRIEFKFDQVTANRKRVLIIGAGEAGSIVIKELQGAKQNEYLPVLVVDDDSNKMNKALHGVQILHNINNILEYVRKYKIDEIIIAIPSASKERIDEWIELAGETNCSIQVSPGLADFMTGRITYRIVRPSPSLVKRNGDYRDIQFSPPDITDSEIEEVAKALKSGWITTGPRTKELERQVAQYVGVNKAVCLNSATAAMELVLRIMGIGPGDEVITTPYTYSASASIIDHVGAKIILVDTSPDSYEMDYDKLESLINEKTKVIIPVDIAGKMCDYERIYAIIERKRHLFKAKNEYQSLINRILIMSDSAHAFGATQKGFKCGQVADFTCFSFHAVKNLTTAEGGAVVWRNDLGFDDEHIYKQFMLFSLHGQSKDALAKNLKGSWEYDIVYPAFKNNMTDIVAALGLAQLERYSKLLQRRKDMIRLYDQSILSNNIQALRHLDDKNESSCHLYLARIPGISEEQRNQIIILMADVGIATNVHYKPLPMFTAYKNLGFKIEDFPNAFAMYQNEITLPLHTLLSDDDIRYIAMHLARAVKKVLGVDGEEVKSV